MIYEQDKTMYNYIVANFKIFKLQMKYMVNTLHERNILNLSKVTYQNSLVSDDMDPDLDPVQAISQGFSEP